MSSMYLNEGSTTTIINKETIAVKFKSALVALGERKKVLIIPPDFTRFHSMSGYLTTLAYEHFGDSVTDIMPALGTHVPMTEEQIQKVR